MKIIFISGLLPSGHYSQYITSGLAGHKSTQLIVYADKDKRNLAIKNCGRIKLVWSKSPRYVWQIIRTVKKDKPDIVHTQHELNMFGGLATALLFPALVLLLRASGNRVAVTIHAAVYRKQINRDFVALFHKKALKPLMLKIFFAFLYRTIAFCAHLIIVHTKLTRTILTADYGVSKKKVHVVPAAIPQKLSQSTKSNLAEKNKYFFYFGYMVRRKGLGYALEGFRKFIELHPRSPYRFILAGGVIKGQEEAYEEIKAIVRRNKLEKRVIFKGFIEEKDQDALYEGAYAVIIPSIISLGSSGPLYHAESYGRCTLVSKVGHFLEDIDDRETGILVSNKKWCEAFQYVVDHPKLIKSIEANVRAKARLRSPYKTAATYIKLYQSLLS